MPQSPRVDARPATVLSVALAVLALGAPSCQPATGTPAPSRLPEATAQPVASVAPGSPPNKLGNNRELNALAQCCSQGVLKACDQLVQKSSAESQYENYGATCGGRNS